MHRLNHTVMFNYINVSVLKYNWIKSTHYKTNMKKKTITDIHRNGSIRVMTILTNEQYKMVMPHLEERRCVFFRAVRVTFCMDSWNPFP